MARKPTPHESAMRILWLMVQKFGLRENAIAHLGQFLTSFPDGPFHSEDFKPGADYAVGKGWISAAQMGALPAVRLTSQGFEAAPQTEPQMENSESRALRLLAAIDEKTRDTNTPVFVAELAPALGISEQEGNAAWQYLADKNLIRTYNLPYTARLNAHGSDTLERAKQNPNQPAPSFGSVTYNTINIQHMEGSSIQQAGSHSTQVQSVAYGQQDFDNLKRALDLMEQYFDQLQLDAASARTARAQIGTLKAQLTDEPNPTILKEAGKTLRNVTEGVVGGLISAGVQPSVWQFVQELLVRMF
jgi:hypothetical protein